MPSICVQREDGVPFVEDCDNDMDEPFLWIDGVEVYDDEDDMRDYYPALGKHELKIVDTEGFLGLKVDDVDHAIELAKSVEAHGEALVGWIETHGEHYYDAIHEDAYTAYPPDRGEHARFSGKEVFAWTYYEENHGEVPTWLIHAVDWDRAAEELTHDLSTYEGSDGTFYVYTE